VRAIGDPAPAGRVPHVRCYVVEGVEAEPVLLGLDRYGVSVHSGSACSSESLERSEVLAAMGVDEDHSLRVSVGWSTGERDVDAFLTAFPTVLAELRALR
jgi:cysteine desulfurase